MKLLIVLIVIVIIFLVQVGILRWIFRIDEIALYLRQIRDLLNNGGK